MCHKLSQTIVNIKNCYRFSQFILDCYKFITGLLQTYYKMLQSYFKQSQIATKLRKPDKTPRLQNSIKWLFLNFVNFFMTFFHSDCNHFWLAIWSKQENLCHFSYIVFPRKNVSNWKGGDFLQSFRSGFCFVWIGLVISGIVWCIVCSGLVWFKD